MDRNPFRVGIALALSFFVCTQAALAEEKVNNRPPVAYRCALDNRPRMLVIDFGDHVFAAYDTQRCYLYKIWRGDVQLTGTVYDTRHGPRPSAQGQVIPTTRTDTKETAGTQSAPPDSVVEAAREPAADEQRRWVGHSLRGNAVVLAYRAADGRVTEITLERAAAENAYPIAITLSTP